MTQTNKQTNRQNWCTPVSRTQKVCVLQEVYNEQNRMKFWKFQKYSRNDKFSNTLETTTPPSFLTTVHAPYIYDGVYQLYQFLVQYSIVEVDGDRTENLTPTGHHGKENQKDAPSWHCRMRFYFYHRQLILVRPI